MQKLILMTGVIATTLVLMLPTTAQAARDDRDGYQGDRQHHKNQRHYRSHKQSRRHYQRDNQRHNQRAYYGYGYGYGYGYNSSRHRYRSWPLNFHIDLGSQHYRDRDVIVVEREVSSASTDVSHASSSEIFVYPRDGQSESKRDQDRYECHLWSRDQTDYDPSRPNGDHSLAPDYQRAIAACLEGRGYTVK